MNVSSQVYRSIWVMLFRLRAESGGDSQLLGDVPELSLQGLPAPVQSRSDRPDRTFQDRRDFLVGELLHEVESAHRPELLGEGGDGGRHILRIDLTPNQPCWIGGPGVEPFGDRVGVEEEVRRLVQADRV